MHACLQHEDSHCCTRAEFFKDGRDHQRPIARRVRGNNEKRDLPGPRNSYESIEESGWVIGGGSFRPIRSNMNYSGGMTSKPQMPAIQNTIFANLKISSNRG